MVNFPEELFDVLAAASLLLGKVFEPPTAEMTTSDENSEVKRAVEPEARPEIALEPVLEVEPEVQEEWSASEKI